MGLFSFLTGGSNKSRMKPQDAQALIESGAVLVDVREPAEWKAGHAPQAVHIPLSQLPSKLSKLSKDKQIVTACKVGGRSARAAAMLRKNGYDVVDMSGGMMAWARAGLPVVASGGGKGRVV